MLSAIMKRRALLASSVCLLLAACQVVGQGESAEFGGTGQATSPFDSAGTRVELRVSVAFDSGTGTFSVIDPTGTLQLRREVEPTSPLHETVNLDGPTGRWVAVLDYVSAKGQRTIEWRNRLFLGASPASPRSSD